jgi:glutamate dehydrogenase (NAD(P)+)
MQRRREEARHELLLGELEKMTGQAFPEEFRRKYLAGVEEIDLVRSGLDDTMRGAYQRMRAVWRERSDVKDLRTAAFVVAIQRIAESYQTKGL